MRIIDSCKCNLLKYWVIVGKKEEKTIREKLCKLLDHKWNMTGNYDIYDANLEWFVSS
jgi:hypothetical protein